MFSMAVQGTGHTVSTLQLAQHVLDLINVISEIDLPVFHIEYKGIWKTFTTSQLKKVKYDVIKPTLRALILC